MARTILRSLRGGLTAMLSRHFQSPRHVTSTANRDLIGHDLRTGMLLRKSIEPSMRKGLTALTAAVVASLTASTSSQSPEYEAARAWFLQVQHQAYEAVMPLTVPDLLVAYRVAHEISPETHERYFAIQYIRFGVFSMNALSATIVQPLGSSIQRQLINLRTKDRAASVPELTSRLALRKETVDIDHCKAIRSQVGRLSGVRVTLPRRDIITLDAPVHQIAVNIGNLAMTATIEDSKAPLVEWAVRTHELLLRCLPAR